MTFRILAEHVNIEKIVRCEKLESRSDLGEIISVISGHGGKIASVETPGSEWPTYVVEFTDEYKYLMFSMRFGQ